MLLLLLLVTYGLWVALGYAGSAADFEILFSTLFKATVSSFKLGEGAYCTWWHPQLGFSLALCFLHLFYFPFKVEQYYHNLFHWVYSNTFNHGVALNRLVRTGFQLALKY